MFGKFPLMLIHEETLANPRFIIRAHVRLDLLGFCGKDSGYFFVRSQFWVPSRVRFMSQYI